MTLPCFPTARSVNATLRCAKHAVYGITLVGLRIRIDRYKGVSKTRRWPIGRSLNTGKWCELKTVEWE